MREIYRREGEEPQEIVLEVTGENAARLRTSDLELELTASPLANGWFLISDGKRTWRACVDREGSWRHVTVQGVGEARLERETAGRRRREAAPGSLASPMPGRVVKVLVREGDLVAKGQELLVVEAMKMEIKVEAPHEGRVKSLRKREGDPCDAGETLAEIEAAS